MIKYEMFYKSTLLCKAVQDQRFCAIANHSVRKYVIFRMTQKKNGSHIKVTKDTLEMTVLD